MGVIVENLVFVPAITVLTVSISELVSPLEGIYQATSDVYRIDSPQDMFNDQTHCTKEGLCTPETLTEGMIDSPLQ